MKKAFIVIFIVFLVLLIAGGALYFWFNRVTNKIFIPASVSKTKTSSTNVIQQAFDDKRTIDMVLLGYGGGNHDGAYLTDSIIALHIDPKTQKIFLISIPRDTWIKIPTNGDDGGYAKINAAYQIGLDDEGYPDKQDQFRGPGGGAKMAEYAVSQVTGLPVSYFVGIDFSGFIRTINTLDGLDINVERGFDDYQYPIEGKEAESCGLAETDIATFSAQLASPSATITELDVFPCRFEHLHFDKGEQHMDGATALKYVRSRHSLQDGTDFGRAQRQRNLLTAVKQKIFSAGFIPKVIPFMSSLGDDLRTDLSLDDVKVFLQNISALNNYQIISLAITDENFLQDAVSSDKQAILISRDGVDNWTSIHKWLKDEFAGKPRPVKAVVQVENGTRTVGLALMATNRLRDLNIEALDPVNSERRDYEKTVVTVFEKNITQTEINKLKKEFGISKVVFAALTQGDYNVLVIVGNDYLKDNK